MRSKILLILFSAFFLIGMSVAQTTPAATTSQNPAQTETSPQQPSPQPATPPQAEPAQPTSPQNTAPSQGTESPQNTAPAQATQPPQSTTPPNQATPDQNQQTPQNPPAANQPPDNNSATSPTQPSSSTSPTATSEGANTDPSQLLNGQSDKWLGKPVTLTNVTVQDTTETGNFWVGTDDAHRILIVKPSSDANLRSIQVQKGETVTISGTVRPADDFMASMTGTDKTVMSNAKSTSGVFLLADKVITPANQH